MTYLDTHVVLWAHDREYDRLSPQARTCLAGGELLLSPAVILELEFLYEIKRLNARALEIISRLSSEIGLRICDLPFPLVVETALAQKWVRDPFDRLIVAQAQANHAALITKDQAIRQHYRRAVW